MASMNKCYEVGVVGVDKWYEVGVVSMDKWLVILVSRDVNEEAIPDGQCDCPS